MQVRQLMVAAAAALALGSAHALPSLPTDLGTDPVGATVGGFAVFNGLSTENKAIVETAASHAHTMMQAMYDARNPAALKRLVAGGAKLLYFVLWMEQRNTPGATPINAGVVRLKCASDSVAWVVSMAWALVRCETQQPPQEALRIDIDLHLDRAPLFRASLQHAFHESLHVAVAAPMHQQTEAMPSADQGKRRLCGPEDHDPAFLRRSLSEAAGMAFRFGAGISGDDDRDQPA